MRAMTRADRAEVSAIQGRDLVRIQSFGDGKHGGIDGSQREVGVFTNSSAIRNRSAEVRSTRRISSLAIDSRNVASAAGPTRVSTK